MKFNKGCIQQFFILIIFVFASSCYATSLPLTPTRVWLNQQLDFAVNKLFQNISPAKALPGAVVAAQSTANPNYYYHWVRDAALVMDALVGTYQTTNDPNIKKSIRNKMFEYLDFTTRIQNDVTQADLGEPKFNIDGTAFNEPWGRPQNDSPALRAISLIHWAAILIANGEQKIVQDKMYDNHLPATLPIKKDLEYVSHHWRDPSYDLWEEVKGEHFYTLMVQRKALIEGAVLARQMRDDGAAQWYESQAKEIGNEIQKFWDVKKNYFVATLNQVGGLNDKYSNLDISVILGLLHGETNDQFLAWDDARVQATFIAILNAFRNLYSINQRPEIPGIALGRYPEDKYSGTNFDGGNPWPLCTLAIAEGLYRYAELIKQNGNTDLALRIADSADQFVERVRYHAESDGSLSEQMDKNTGYMISARDLSWNYAALLTTRGAVLGL